ncbi:hypothetical protein MRX96_013657 [Rhipicephalus microplus]
MMPAAVAHHYYEYQPRDLSESGAWPPRSTQTQKWPNKPRREEDERGEAEENSVGESERSGSSEPPAPEGVGSDATAALELVTQKHSDPLSRSARFVNAC